MIWLVTLKLKDIPEVGLDVEGILPRSVEGKKVEEIEKLEIQHGNQVVEVGDFFDVSIDEDEDTLIFDTNLDLNKIKRIGAFLDEGDIIIRGSAGMYVGAFMEGGRILVEGDVGSFSAMDMSGGELIIKGNAGDYLGASYRGEWKGMSSGKILVEGNTGKEVGCNMVGGVIIVKGTSDTFCGVKMNGGIIFAEKAKERAGASMRSGAIIINETSELLPGFKFEGKMKPEIEIGNGLLKGDYNVYSGDHAEKGAKGKIFVRELTD